MHEARLYDRLNDGRVRCGLCAHRCLIPAGARGVCAVRENRDGTLFSLVYGRVIVQHVDPIEKKPLFHFYPGSRSFSIACAGCNLRCTFCQNAEISQLPRQHGRILGQTIPAEAVVEAAQRMGCRTISYTYTEPTIFFEYAYDISLLAHAQGLANVFVTNGFMTPEMLQAYHPFLDAANVDLKAFNDGFYRHLCGARLQPVLDALKTMKAQGVWLEVTTLLIPGLNDDPAELRDLTAFLVKELGAETPWHVSRFHPDYQLLDAPPTPPAALLAARDIGREAGLHYVYVGNWPGLQAEDTLCPGCGDKVIGRVGFVVTEAHIEGGACARCHTPIAGIGL
ncbi:MAG: AmmeMemoRadiSam system radical SAM enzyme [Anaerolineae bacterium]